MPKVSSLGRGSGVYRVRSYGAGSLSKRHGASDRCSGLNFGWTREGDPGTHKQS